jgi:hypothetical protein
MTVKLPTPFEPLVTPDLKISEVWYRYLSESVIATNSASTSLASLSSALTAITTTPTYATQADEEAGTSTVAVVTPSVQQYHPSAAKAWGVVEVTTAGVASLSTGYNVSGVTYPGTGNVIVNFSVPFATTRYTITATAQAHSTDGAGNIVSIAANPAATSFEAFHYTAGALLSHPRAIYFTCFGDQ